MASFSLWSWVPRPKTFLGLISLQTGTEMITLTLIINKLTGFYGLLAVLTGYSLSLLQLSMYVYSLAVLVLLMGFFPHIRRQTSFEVLGLAWLYVLDTVLNAAYTAAFAVDWFAHSTALDRHAEALIRNGREIDSDPNAAEDPNSFLPRDAYPDREVLPDATIAQGTPVTPDAHKTETGKHIGPEESWTSLAIIIVVTIVRVYLALVVMAFARQVLSRREAEREAGSGAGGGTKRDQQGWTPEEQQKQHRKQAGEALFAHGTPEGRGWRGDAGRRMLACGREYWLGEKGQEECAKNASSKLRTSPA